MAEPFQFTTGNADLDACAKQAAGAAIAGLSKAGGIGYPEAIGLLHAMLTLEIARYEKGLEYLWASAIWMRAADMPADITDIELESLEAQRVNLFEQWKVAAQKVHEDAHAAMTEDLNPKDGENDAQA